MEQAKLINTEPARPKRPAGPYRGESLADIFPQAYQAGCDDTRYAMGEAFEAAHWAGFEAGRDAASGFRPLVVGVLCGGASGFVLGLLTHFAR